MSFVPCFCGGLLALGASNSAALILAEWRWHVADPMALIRQAGTAIVLVVLAGLILPRSIIRRRSQWVVPGRAAAAARVASGFAGTLAGVLLLANGGIAGFSLWCVRHMEDIRAWLSASVVAPEPTFMELIAVPLQTLLIAQGACAMLAFTSLYGWNRLKAPGQSARAFLMTTGAGTWVGLLLATSQAGLRVGPFLSLAALFGAGALAVLVRPQKAAAARRPAQSPDPATDSDVAPLLLAASCALFAADAVIRGARDWSTPMLAIQQLAWLACTALAGLVITAMLPRRIVGVGAAAAFLAAMTFLITFNDVSVRNGTVLAAAEAALASAAITCLAIRGTPDGGVRTGRLQNLVAFAGLGLGLGAIGWSLAAAGLQPEARQAMLAAVACLSCFWLAMTAEASAWVGRLAPLVVTAILLALSADRMRNTRSRSSLELEENGPASVRAAVSHGGPLVSLVESVPGGGLAAFGELSDPASGWWIDTRGPRLDFLIVPVDDGPSRADSDRAAARFVRRCSSALRLGGRLVVELPAPEVSGPAMRVFAAPPERRFSSFLFQARGEPGAEPRAALICGRDAPAWLARTGVISSEAQLYPVATAAQLRSIVLQMLNPQPEHRP